MARRVNTLGAILSCAILGVLAACGTPESPPPGLPPGLPGAPPGAGAAAAAPAYPAGCTGLATALARLEARYGERPVASGITTAGGLLQVTAAADGGWTLLVTLPGGDVTCALAAGEGWRTRPPQDTPNGPET